MIPLVVVGRWISNSGLLFLLLKLMELDLEIELEPPIMEAGLVSVMKDDLLSIMEAESNSLSALRGGSADEKVESMAEMKVPIKLQGTVIKLLFSNMIDLKIIEISI